MTEYVRVREGGWEYTVERRLLVNDERVTVLDKSPFAPSGDPAPPKPVMPLGEPAPGTKKDRERTHSTAAKGGGKDAGQSSADNKEN
jgi:hypothetical protein